MKRVAVVCPGRGTYGRPELGILTDPRRGASAVRDEFVKRADRWRAAIGRKSVSELDAADRFGSEHLKGENAAALIFTSGAVDFASLADDLDVVCVCGNSMGWYTALHVSGAFSFDDGLRLSDTMGGFQASEGVIGGQVIVPVVDEDWRPDPVLAESVDGAVEQVNRDGHQAWTSIRLGGYRVLAGDLDGVRLLLQSLPRQQVGEREYPFQLLGHSAFHTPLMAGTSRRAHESLSDLPWRAPSVNLIDGRGHVFRPYTARGEELRDYTFSHQVTRQYDFTTSLRVALREFAPDALVLLGPGETLGGAIGQILVEEGWSGIRSKADFIARQKGEDPILYAMGRPDQRVAIAR